ncbi:HNH endonuclease signature motif containing protein [Bacillus sp. S13(2024)]|uniref:HNH endonuclease n=1 Tax=unclassified Bacillus (in: firmicutes) TaxID=185979 RepID=UPI003D1AF5A9
MINRIEEAIEFLNDNVFEPAIINPKLPGSIVKKVKNTRDRVSKFKKVGDLNIYLSRFESLPEPGKDEVYKALKNLNLKTYEDIVPKFRSHFKDDLFDITNLEDFVIGKKYTSWDISIYSRTYNNLSGIYLIGDEPNYKAIFSKVTMKDGKYQNEWIVENKILKHYMKSMGDNFDPTFKVNRGIINSGNIPIYVFFKEGTVLTLAGIFKYVRYHVENDGSKWFELVKVDSLQIQVPITEEEYEEEFKKQINNAKKIDSEERKRRLQNANKKPGIIQVITTNYRRNPDVVAEVLERAKGICEYCHQPAPFIRVSDGTPYLEVHHVLPLAEGGEDTVTNAVAICPNCHRKAHFGIPG